MGGGFGAKSRTYPEELALGYYARAVGRPVRWTETRSENMVAMAHGRAQTQTARMGGTRDGRITAYQLDVLQDAGAYPTIGAVLPTMTQRMTTGVYDLDNVGFSGVSVVTNTISTHAFRGAGRPEAAVAIERMVDRFSAEIGMDPAEVRRRNLVPRFLEPYTTGIGTVYDVGDYPEALERALRAADYDDLRAEQARRRADGDPVCLGIGIGVYVEITAGAAGPEFGAVELLAGGRLRVRSGATPYGQGHVTTWAMIVSDRTGVPVEQIEVVHGDTDLVRSGGLTVGSRSVQLAGPALAEATAALVEQACQRAADRLEADVADVVLDAGSGRFHVSGTPARTVGWADLADGDEEPLSAESDFEAPMPTFPFGAHVAVVDVDTETGSVRLRQHVAVDDAGTADQPAPRRGPGARRHRSGRCPGPAGGRALRRERPTLDDELRRLPGDLGRRAAAVRRRAHGDADLGQRAGSKGRRRVGHDRLHPLRVQRGHRRARASGRPPPGDPPHPGEDLAGGVVPGWRRRADGYPAA